MLNKLFDYAKKPELYARSYGAFWDDEHISKKMLECHLDPEADAASRNHYFIEQSAEWIQKIAPPSVYRKALDLGCGPGLYAERLFDRGYSVTGIDFSKRSINYAKERADYKGQAIDYIYKNYLEIDYQEIFDLVLFIYCDYAVLIEEERKALLKKIYQAMKKGGEFIFDVHTPRQYADHQDRNVWYLCEGEGFWKAKTHMCLESHYRYNNNIQLAQYVVMTEDGQTDVIRLWDHCFTKEMIMEEIMSVGFRKCEIYADVTGKPYDDLSKTLTVVAEK